MTRKIIEIEVERIRPNLRLIYHYEAIESWVILFDPGARSNLFKSGLTGNASGSGTAKSGGGYARGWGLPE